MTKFLAGSDQLEEDNVLEARREASRLVKVKAAELTPVIHVRPTAPNDTAIQATTWPA